jgi:hypothetical protein
MLRRAKRDSIRPYTLRVDRDHGGGLWTLEDNRGQLYLAVLSRENSRLKSDLQELRRAEGRMILGKTGGHVRVLPDP